MERHLTEQDRRIQQVHDTLQRLEKVMNSLDVSIELLYFQKLKEFSHSDTPLLATNVFPAKENQ